MCNLPQQQIQHSDRMAWNSYPQNYAYGSQNFQSRSNLPSQNLVGASLPPISQQPRFPHPYFQSQLYQQRHQHESYNQFPKMQSLQFQQQEPWPQYSEQNPQVHPAQHQRAQMAASYINNHQYLS